MAGDRVVAFERRDLRRAGLKMTGDVETVYARRRAKRLDGGIVADPVNPLPLA